MPNDYYSDAAPPEKSEPKGEMAEQGSDSAVATLPKSILAGKDFQVGDEVVLEITQLTGDSVVVKYAPEKGDKEQTSPPAEEAPPEEAPAMGGGGGGGGNPLYE